MPSVRGLPARRDGGPRGRHAGGDGPRPAPRPAAHGARHHRAAHAGRLPPRTVRTTRLLIKDHLVQKTRRKCLDKKIWVWPKMLVNTDGLF